MSAPWRLKARALLAPEPDGELDKRLGSLGLTAGADDGLLIRECARDAHDAQVVLDLPPAAPPSPSRDAGLRHPLSAQDIGGERRDPATLERESLRLLEAWTADAPRSYRTLWREFCDPKFIASHVPSDPRLADHTVAAHRSLTAALVGARHADPKRQAALLYVHLGPVQGFIATARRTHDLWVGSFTLTYLAARAAKTLAERLGPDAVVAPSLAHVRLLDRLLFERPTDRLDTLRSSLTNKLLAIVPAAAGGEIAREVAQAIASAWSGLAEAVRQRLHQDLHRDAPGWGASFTEQVDAHPEIEAVLLPWPRTRGEVRDVLARTGLRRDGEGAAAEEPLGWWLDDVRAETEARAGVAYGLLFDLSHRVLAAQRRTPGRGPAYAGDHRPKCALCGEREQVGPVTEQPGPQRQASRTFWRSFSENKELRASLQVVEGEGLCAVCLSKRFAPQLFFGGTTGQLGLDWGNRGDRPLLRFPSVESIASAPCRLWLHDRAPVKARDAWARAVEELQAQDCLDFDAPGNLLRGLGEVGTTDPFLRQDGEWLYEMSYQAAAVWRRYFPGETRRAGDPTFELLQTPLNDARAGLRKLLSPAAPPGGPRLDRVAPSPYYAVLVLDGDNMGQWLTGRHPRMPTLREMGVTLDTGIADRRRPLFPALHAELSRRLGALAQELHAVVERHLGRVVYSGGDDLLAFLPLATALPCLSRIRETVREARFLGDRVTISAGMAIAHVHDPLSRTLDLARCAEKRAKNAGRDSFTVVVDKRSGAELRLTLPFEIKGGAPVIGCFMGLLDPADERSQRDEERRPLAGVTVAHRIEEELRALGLDDDSRRRDEPHDAKLLEAFRHRVGMLLGFRPSLEAAARTRPAAALLLSLLGDRARPRDAVNLLLLAHFFLREEHGLATRALSTRLDKGIWP